MDGYSFINCVRGIKLNRLFLFFKLLIFDWSRKIRLPYKFKTIYIFFARRSITIRYFLLGI